MEELTATRYEWRIYYRSLDGDETKEDLVENINCEKRRTDANREAVKLMFDYLDGKDGWLKSVEDQYKGFLDYEFELYLELYVLTMECTINDDGEEELWGVIDFEMPERLYLREINGKKKVVKTYANSDKTTICRRPK